MRQVLFFLMMMMWAGGCFAQTQEQLPVGAVPYSSNLFKDLDGWIWTGKSGNYTRLAPKTKVDSLIALGYSNAQIDSIALDTYNLARDRDNHTGTQGISTVDGLQDELNSKINSSEKGIANGVASLDGSMKIPMSQVPDALIGSVNYQGNWDPSTNTPILPSTPTSETKGHYYIASTSGVWNGTTFENGDWIISNGSEWGKVDNNNKVVSVAGKQGAVVLNVADITGLQGFLAGKVDKVTGKGLSTEDYTTAEKNKLSGIQTGAEVNLNADWNATSGDARILNKPTTLVGYGITDAVSLTNDEDVFGSKTYKGRSVFNQDVSLNVSTPPNTIQIGRNSLGMFIQSGDSSDVANYPFTLRSYATESVPYQLTLGVGGVELAGDIKFNTGSEFRIKDPDQEYFRVNSSKDLVLSASNGRAVFIRPNGSATTTGQAILGTDGVLSVLGGNSAQWNEAYNMRVTKATFNNTTRVLSIVRPAGNLNVSIPATGGGGSSGVNSVGLTAPTGFTVSGSPVTSSGTLSLAFASGYSLPTTSSQTNWNTGYNHSQLIGSNPHQTTFAQLMAKPSTVSGFGINDALTTGGEGQTKNGDLTLKGAVIFQKTSTVSSTGPPNSVQIGRNTSGVYVQGRGETPDNSFTLRNHVDANGSQLSLGAGGIALAGDILYTSPTFNLKNNMDTFIRTNDLRDIVISAGLGRNIHLRPNGSTNALNSAILSKDGVFSAPIIDGSLNASQLTTGVVPVARLGTNTGTSSLFLRGDNTWATPPNTTYSAGSGLTLSGTTFSLPVTQSGSGNGVASVTQTTNGITVTKANFAASSHTHSHAPDITYPVGTGSATALNVSTNSIFTRSISSSTTYTFTGLPSSGQAKYFQVVVTNTSGSAITVGFPSNIKFPQGQSGSVPASSTAIFTIMVNGTSGGYLSKTLY